MSDERNRADDSSTPGGQDRRTFLRTLGVIGGTLAGAGIAGAAPILSRETRVSAQVGAAGRLRRSSAALKLGQPLGLQKLSQGRSGPRIPASTARGRPRRAAAALDPPAPAADALRRAGRCPEGERLLARAQRRREVGEFPPLTQVMSTNPLAGAYAGGITLTPTGCQYTLPARSTEPERRGPSRSHAAGDGGAGDVREGAEAHHR